MIDLFFLFLEDFEGIDLGQYEPYLSLEEKAVRDRYIFQKDKDQYLLTRVLVRKVFSDRLKVKHSDLEFDKNAYGKPALKGLHAKLAFNISHSSGLIALAISDDAETIGIDLENTTRSISIQTIMPTVFVDHEIAAINSLPEKDQRSRFFDFWTLKESYMKAVGKGFHLAPNSFSFNFVGDEIFLHEPPLESSFKKVWFHLSNVEKIYQLAICQSQKITAINASKISPNLDCMKFDF